MVNPCPYLVFKAHFNVKILNPERVLLISEESQFLLCGQLYVEIAKMLLSKDLIENDLIEKLSLTFSKKEIKYAIDRLIRKGYMTFSERKLPLHHEAYWSEQGLNFNQLRRLQSTKISIKNLSSSEASNLFIFLTNLGVQIVDKDENLEICLVDNYINSNIKLLNQNNIKKRKNWLLAKPSGSILWLGPIFRSTNNGCWECLSKNIKENRHVEVDIFGDDDDALNICSKSLLPTNNSVALSFIANEAVKWLLSDNSILEKNILTIDMKNLEMHLHHINYDHDCNFCSKKAQNSFVKRSLSLRSSLKNFITEYDERNCSYEEALEKICHVVSPITGIIAKLKYLKVNNTHIYYTIRNLPTYNVDGNQKFSIRIPDVAVGKGVTKIQAKVGCIAESIERYNCTYYNQFQIRTRYVDIKNQSIHPYSFLLFSEFQYKERDRINLISGNFNQIPQKFNETDIIGWTPFISLINDKEVYIPSSYCYLNYPFFNETEMVPGDSNGCASGNTLEEAINYAILELIERDAFAIWWYNRIQRPGIDLESLNDPNIKNFISTFKSLNRELVVLDITSDLNVPSFVAISWLSNGKRIFTGSASHLNPKKAILRALNELSQVMSRDSLSDNMILNKNSEKEKDFLKWILNENIEDHNYMKPKKTIKVNTKFNHSDDFLNDIHFYLNVFKKNKLDVLFLDMSRPNIPLYSVKIVIPGLRHFWARLAPGRIFEVPVKLKWMESIKNENQMNPIAYFL